jgi:hypothetical protein
MHAEEPVEGAALDFFEEEATAPSRCERAVSLSSSLRISEDMVAMENDARDGRRVAS